MKKALIVLLLSAAAALHGTSALELNSRGYQSYKAEKYDKALKLFQQSAKKDATYVYAHYNYSCTLSILLKKSYCSYLSQVDSMFKHLKKTFKLRPDYRRKALKDRDLQFARNYLRFYKLIGWEWDKPRHLRRMLVNCTWAVPGMGAINPIAEITFQKNGSFVIGHGWGKQQNGKYGRNKVCGHFLLRFNNANPTLHLRYNSGKKEKIELKPWQGFIIPTLEKILNYGTKRSKVRNFLGDCQA